MVKTPGTPNRSFAIPYKAITGKHNFKAELVFKAKMKNKLQKAVATPTILTGLSQASSTDASIHFFSQSQTLESYPGQDMGYGHMSPSCTQSTETCYELVEDDSQCTSTKASSETSKSKHPTAAKYKRMRRPSLSDILPRDYPHPESAAAEDNHDDVEDRVIKYPEQTKKTMKVFCSIDAGESKITTTSKVMNKKKRNVQRGTKGKRPSMDQVQSRLLSATKRRDLMNLNAIDVPMQITSVDIDADNTDAESIYSFEESPETGRTKRRNPTAELKTKFKLLRLIEKTHEEIRYWRLKYNEIIDRQTLSKGKITANVVHEQ